MNVPEHVVAHHEAGHALVSLLLGLPLSYVTILREAWPPDALGHVFSLEAVVERPDRERWDRALGEIVSLYAGAAGVHVGCGVPLNAVPGAGSDYEEAYTLFTEHFGFAFAPEEIWAVLRLLKQKAVELVRTHRREVERVALALLEAKTLTGPQVRAVAGLGRQPGRPS